MQQFKKPLSGCDLDRCRYGSIMSMVHPCKRGCKHSNLTNKDDVDK